MPQPTLTDLHVDGLLTNLSLAFEQSEDAYVHMRVFPNLSVNNRSDLYAQYSRADWNRDTMRLRAPGTETAGGGYKVDLTASYTAAVWGLHKDIDDQSRGNTNSQFDLDGDATRWLVQQSLTNREVAWASAFFTTSIWTTTRTGVVSSPSAVQVVQWSDYSASKPIQDVRAAKQAVQLAGLMRPNKLVLGRPVFDVLCDHPDFLTRIWNGQTPGAPAKVLAQTMAALFEVDEVLVMDAIKNTGGEAPISQGINAAESNAFIGNKAALLVYTPPAVGLRTPCAGINFAWTGLMGNTPSGHRIKSFYINQIASTRIEIDSAYVFKCVGPDMGCFFPTIIA